MTDYIKQIEELIAAGEKATQDEIIHGGSGQIYDGRKFSDLIHSSCCNGRAHFKESEDGEFAALAFNSRPAIKAMYDALKAIAYDNVVKMRGSNDVVGFDASVQAEIAELIKQGGSE